MLQKMMKSLPVAALIFMSKFDSSLGDAAKCGEDVMAMMMENDNELGDLTAKMLKDYNETCNAMDACSFDLEENTRSYIQQAAGADDTPTLPEIPMVANVVADFDDFETHETYKAYTKTCISKDGIIRFVNANLRLKGTAMDLVDIDIVGNMKNFPMCLVMGCDDEDLEVVLEEAVKYAIFQNTPDLSNQQKAVLQGMNIALACAASGIETCELSVTETDASITKGLSESGGAVAYAGQVTSLLVTALGAWFAIN